MAVKAKGFSMDARRLVALVAVVAVALVAVPAAASAKTVEFRGVVSGSPYGASNGYMAVPVLFSKQTARNVGLKSPVGLLVVKRTRRVSLPGGAARILPVGMRTGDRFKGTVPMRSTYTQSFYPRITFSSVSVYFRSKELSLAEMSAAIEAMRKALADLQNQLNALKASSIKAFEDVYAQLADLRQALAALQALSVTDFQAQIDALTKRLDDLIAGLPDFSQFALLSQLPDLTGYLKLTDLTTALGGNSVITTLQTQVSDLTGQVTDLTADLATVCSAVENASVTLPAPLNTVVPVTVDTGGVC
jgi:uncharacterized coiled-coil protein SlyX